jgi:hypothetical protein
MRSDHGLHRDRGRRYRWSDHHPYRDSDQTGPVDDPERSCWVVRRVADQISLDCLWMRTEWRCRVGDTRLLPRDEQRNRQPDEDGSDD